MMALPADEPVPAATAKLYGATPVPGVTRGKLIGALILAVTAAPADARIVIPGTTAMVALFDLLGSLTEVAVTVTGRLAVRTPLGGV
jgi:hypothetical protein